MLSLADRWVWDFWFAQVGELTHVFYLQAPKSLGDPILRHRHARFGHAVSSDLTTWDILPDPDLRGPAGAWDDMATWTGSAVEGADGTWNLFYTGTTWAEGGLVQRIGLATSSDLMAWERFGTEPVMQADPRWYEMLDLGVWQDQAWRDPWIFRDPSGSGYHALVTARACTGDPSSRGVIGHAVSSDLHTWEVRPPLVSPSGFGQLEVPQVVDVAGQTFLVFSTGAEHVAPARRALHPELATTGTYICRAPGPLGPFEVPESTLLLPYSDRYAGKLVQHRGSWFFMGFIYGGEDAFVGVLDDPVPFEPDRVGAPLEIMTG